MSPIAMQKHTYVSQIEIHSPTALLCPDDDDDDEMALDSPAPIPRQSSLEGMKPVAELV